MNMAFKLIAAAMMFSSAVNATTSTTELPDKAKARLKNLGIEINYSEKSPVNGPIYSLGTDKGIVYSTDDGQYVFVGKLFKVGDNQVTDLSEKTIVEGVRNFVRNTKTITFSSPSQKFEVAVFTDITCGFCKQLHGQIDEYLAKGITLHFLAFPRAGIASVGAENMAKIWCSTDPQKSLTAAMTHGVLPENKATDACRRTVAAQYEIGDAIPVQGTPTLIPMSGKPQVMPGYQSPESLLKLLSESQTATEVKK